MTAPVLTLRDVRRVHSSGPAEVVALDGVDLTVTGGELVAIMGPSGSGKTTLLALAGGLDEATSGEVVVEGTPLRGLRRSGRAAVRLRSVGYVFQELNLLPALTAVENVALPAELDGARARAARRGAMDTLEQLGLAEFADRYPHDLSGGQQQRVAIARALTGDRRLLLADEPTGALDSAAGEDVMRLLRARADLGAAVVVVTHDAAHAAWADRVVFLSDGRVVDTSRPLVTADQQL